MKKISAVIIGLFLLLNGLAAPTVMAAGNPLEQGYVEGYLKNIIITPDASATDPTAAPASARATRSRSQTPAAPVATTTSLVIEDYDGAVYQLKLSPAASLSIDQIPARISDFRPGIEVYGELQGSEIVLLEGYSTAALGYIASGSQTRQGTIKAIDRDQIQLVMANGEITTVYTTAATVVQRNGQSVTLSSIFVGDRVKVYFDDSGSNTVGRMQVEGPSVEIKDIYRGTLQAADRVEDTITLQGVKTLTNGSWQDYQSLIKMAYNSKTPIYVGAQKIPGQSLKYYQGKEVYMAVSNLWGSDYIEKMIIKAQYESVYNEKVEDVNWYAGQFELANKQNISISDGTIVVKNGRLVDKSLVLEGCDTMVVADGRLGTKTADLVCILGDSLNNSNVGQYQVYFARLNLLTENSVAIQEYFVLNDNCWESFNEDKELFYDQDTSLYDQEEAEFISCDEFLGGDYVSADTSDCWYAYLYTDGDRIVAASLQDNSDSLLRQRISMGIIAGLTEDQAVGWKVEMTQAGDWSSLNSQWRPRHSNLTFSIDQALLVKDNRCITVDDLKVGDHLYVVRDDFQGKVVVVK